MPFTIIGRPVGEAIEKGLSSAIKAADLRWYDYGPDMKKSTKADNMCLGAVAYVIPDDTAEPTGPGTLIKLFFDFEGGSADQLKMESSHPPGNAVSDGVAWVQSVMGVIKGEIATKYAALT